MQKNSRFIWFFDRVIPPAGSPKAEWDKWHADYDQAKAATQQKLALAANLAFDAFIPEACPPGEGCEWCKERAEAILAVYELAGLTEEAPGSRYLKSVDKSKP